MCGTNHVISPHRWAARNGIRGGRVTWEAEVKYGYDPRYINEITALRSHGDLYVGMLLSQYLLVVPLGRRLR